jgi:hypothetical protein
MVDIGQTDFNQDWWQREKQKRQKRVLLFLILLLVLIGYFYWQSHQGITGQVATFDFDTSNHIAFIQQDANQNSHLYVVRIDGTNLRRMTAEDDRSTKREPVWTADGKNILYASNRNDSRTYQIWRMGGGDIKQATLRTGQKSMPFISPRGNKFGFITQGAVKWAYLNGNEPLQILPPPRAGSTDTDNPNEIANSVEPRGPFLYAQFGSDGVSVAGVQTLNPEDNPAPLGDWSEVTAANDAKKPGGQSDANTLGEANLGEQIIRVLTAEMEKAATLDSGREVSLSWQGDALKLATSFTELVTKDPNGKKAMISGVRLWDLSGKEPKEPKYVFIGFGYTLEPKNVSLSPDGKRIAFEMWRLKSEGNRELRGIAIMDTDKTYGVQTVDQAEGAIFQLPAANGAKPQMPRWSPDGSRLLYEVVNPNGLRDLWIVNADGTNPINLTKDLEGDKSQAVWCPVMK